MADDPKTTSQKKEKKWKFFIDYPLFICYNEASGFTETAKRLSDYWGDKRTIGRKRLSDYAFIYTA